MNTTFTLVTGATRGIGAEIARQLAAAGHTVYLGARDLGRGERLAAGWPGDVRPVALDVTDDASIAAAAARIDGEAGRLDVLVNNAAVNPDLGPEGMIAPGDVTPDQMRAAFETNVVGLAAVTNAVLPLLRRSAGGRIVNLSSAIASLTLMTDPADRASQRRLLAYSSSKAAVNALTLLYANELRDTGIRVVAADPGVVATDMNGHTGPRTVEEGARIPVLLATREDRGETGVFVAAGDDGAPVALPW